MNDEADIFEILASLSDETDAGMTPESPEASSRPAPGEIPSITIRMERELAVMLVGADATRNPGIRPHISMTRGASPEKFADCRAAVAPLFRDGVKRVLEDRTHRPKSFIIRATSGQVLALKVFCHRYADFLQDHLDRYQSEENLHRSRRRFEQAGHVIDEINAALGLIPEHGRALERGRRDAIALAKRLDAAINNLRIRGEGLEDQTILPLLDLRESVRRCLALCGRPRLDFPGPDWVPAHGSPFPAPVLGSAEDLDPGKV